MKAKDFGHFLAGISSLSEFYGVEESVQAWRSLATFFDAHPTATVSNICKLLDSAMPAVHSGTRADKVAKEVSAIRSTLGPFIKKSLNDDLNLLARSLEAHRANSLNALLAATNDKAQSTRNSRGGPLASVTTDELVEKYLKMLEAAFGDETVFVEVFTRLKSDKAIKAPAAKKLAKAFAKESATSKEAALVLIWTRHAALMESREKSANTGGRTAA